MACRKATGSSAESTANVGFEAKLVARPGEYEGSDPEDPDEYRAENIFWVPREPRGAHLQAVAL